MVRHREAARGPLVLMRLAAALKLAGDQPRAEGAATLALGSVYARGEEFWGDYSSGLGDRAATLALALEQGLLPASERGRILDVAREARGKSSLSTQDQIALLKLARALGGGQAAPLRGALVLGGEAQDFSTTGWFSRDLDLAQLAQSPQLRIDSAGPAYVVLDSIGVPRHPSPTPNTGVRLSARWFRHDGSPYTGGSLKEGEGLVVHLVVDADERLADALVVDLLPGGLEIENLNLLDTRQLAQMVIDGTQLDEWRDYSANVRYQEYREDRYVAAPADGSGFQHLGVGDGPSWGCAPGWDGARRWRWRGASVVSRASTGARATAEITAQTWIATPPPRLAAHRRFAMTPGMRAGYGDESENLDCHTAAAPAGAAAVRNDAG